jgi:hypothetical protein
MLKSHLLYTALLATMLASTAFAQTATPPAVTPGTNAADQQQIEQGLQNGSLSTGEARSLEQNQKRIDNAEAHGASQQKLNTMQNNFETKTNTLENNTVTGNPTGARDLKMQGDVQRNVNQQNRIQQGVTSGQMTTGEEKAAERGQARVNRAEARGHLNKANAMENRQSKKIYHKKHNGNTTTPAAGGTTPGTTTP